MNRNPFKQFQEWYQEAEKSPIKLPDAMTLATASRKGVPSARIVLYKGTNKKGICFFTNYKSRKSLELIQNPKAALVFYWPSLDRQIRIEGKIEIVSAEESDTYWSSRPRESQISAMASHQSAKISSRSVLEKRFQMLTQKFENKEIPRPQNWGGFCLIPHRFEFWIAGDHRLHDRFCYIKKSGKWSLTQLSP